MADRNRPNTNTPKNSKSSQDSSSTAAVVGQYSRALNNSAEMLKEAAKSFQSSSKDIITNSNSNTDRVIKALSSFAKSFDKDIEDIDKSLSDKQKSFEEALEDNDKRTKRENEQNITKRQAVMNAAIGTLRTVLGAATRNFERGFNSVLNNYNEKYTSITSQMGKSNAEYTQMLMDQTKRIRQENLTNQFSQIDFTNSLESVLSAGIRDIGNQNAATEMAWQNMITNQVLPMINTNTRTYVRYSKVLGDTFNKGITAIGTQIQEQFGAEGLSEGQADTFLNTIASDIFSSAVDNNMSKDEAMQMVQQAMSAYGDLSNQYGSQVAEYALGELKTYLEHPSSASVTAIDAATAAGIDFGSGSVSGEQFQSFLNNLIKNTSQWSSGVGAGIYGEAVGTDPEIPNAIRFGQKYGNAGDIRSLVIDTTKTYDELTDKLEDGFTRSITAQQDIWNQNAMADLADKAGQYIPHFGEVLDDIRTIASLWFTAWAARGTLGSGGESRSLFSRLGSSDIMGSSIGGQVASIPSQGLGGALRSGGAGAGGSLSGLGTALGVAGIAAGTIWAGVDAWKAGSRAAENNMSTGQVIGQGARGFFTGSSTAGMTSDQKKAYYEQNGYFSFKDAALNAGKWALVGGGAGTLAGGPLGTAIGAVAGGIVGFATNAIDQAIDASRYKALAEASEDASNQLSNLKRASEEYNNTIKKDVSVTKALSIAKGEIKVSESEQADALSTLQEYYPGYTKNVEKITSLTDDQIKAMQLQLDLERLKSEKEMKETAAGMSIDASAYQKGHGMGDSASIEAAMLLSKDPNRYVNNVDTLITDISKKTGMSWNEVQSNLIDSSIITASGNGKFKKLYSSNSSYYEDYLTETQENRQAFVENEFAKIEEELSNLITTYSNAKAQDDLKGSKATLKTLYEDLYTDVSTYRDQAVHADYVLWKTLGSQYSSELGEIQKVVGSDNAIPYRTGINKVLKDSVPATLHLGEAVLSPAIASKARELSEGGIAGFITSLYSLVSSEATPMSQSQSLSNLAVDAINAQTDTLAEVLNLILADTTAIAKKLTGQSSGGSQVDERLRNFNRSYS